MSGRWGHCRGATRFVLAVWGVVLIPARVDAAEPIGPILAEMLGQSGQFRADKLHARGVEGLSAVLDWFLPDTAQAQTVDAPDARVAELVAELGDESSRVREAATQKLFRLGAAAQAALVEAARSSDAEISWRAVRILRAWETERNQNVNNYVTGFSVYLSGINDEPRLHELARRSKLALDAGLPAAGDGRRNGRQQIVQLCIHTLARAGKDEYTDSLRPFVKQGDARVSLFVVQAVAGSLTSDGHYPAILLDALESKEQQVVTMAVNCAVAGSDARRADEVKDRLHAILKGNDENLKLQACRPLISQFDDAEALDYVRTLLAGPKENLARKQQALYALSDTRATGKPIPPKVLEILTPLIKSNETKTKASETSLRLAAVNVLVNFGGEDVVRMLIPLLGDPLSSISRAASRGLQMQPDRKMVRGLLAAAAKDDGSEKVKQQAAMLVKQIDAGPATSPSTRSSRVIRRAPIILQEDADDIFQ